MQQGTSPADDFYEERLARARALPEAERSADVRQWLRLHEELGAALAALPPLPPSATPQRPLVESLGGDVALAALLRFLAAAFSDSARDPVHPSSTLERLVPQLPPFFHVWDLEGASNKVRFAADPGLECLVKVTDKLPQNLPLETGVVQVRLVPC